jgi:hypothetical protein
MLYILEGGLVQSMNSQYTFQSTYLVPISHHKDPNLTGPETTD